MIQKKWNYFKSLTFHSTQTKIRNFVNSRLVPMWSHSKVYGGQQLMLSAVFYKHTLFHFCCLAISKLSQWRCWFKPITKLQLQKLHSPSVWHSDSYNLNPTTTKFFRQIRSLSSKMNSQVSPQKKVAEMSKERTILFNSC